MSESTILSIVSMNPTSTNLDENDSILASRQLIHRLLTTDVLFDGRDEFAATPPDEAL